MICQDCRGKGTVRRLAFIPPEAGWPPGATETLALPCPGCGGSGVMSCCDGAVGCAEDIPGGGTGMSKAFEIALGGRLGLRSAARQLLEAVDKLAEHELLEAGYSRHEVAALESIAAWRIEGVPFGEWP